ncbi:MAG: hypothetical protein JNK05_29580 [Myxococcales bacterium]|nr:hypothetical protein [Myxococcales bacterium]
MTTTRISTGVAVLISCAGCLGPYRFHSTRTDAGDGASVDGSADADVVLDAPSVDAPSCSSPITKLRAFEGATCAQRANGDVYCWGSNVPPDGTSMGLGAIRRIAARADDFIVGGYARSPFVCVLAGDAVQCAGGNAQGQLGLPPDTRTPALAPLLTVGGVTGVRAMSAGLGHVCVLRSDTPTSARQVVCWGFPTSNRTGRIPTGLGPPTTVWGEPTVLDTMGVTTPATFESIHSAGTTNMVVARLASGRELFGWGAADFSTFPIVGGGAGTVTPNNDLDFAPFQAEFGKLLVSSRLVCGVKSTQPSLYCLGITASGVFGSGVNMPTNMWTSLASPSPIAMGDDGALAAVGSLEAEDSGTNPSGFACAVFTNQPSVVSCIGSNRFGQLGTFSGVQSSTWEPVETPSRGTAGDGTNIRQLVAGAAHACVLTTRNEVYCWGRDVCGERGPEFIGSSDKCQTLAPERPARQLPNRIDVPCPR